MSPLRLVMVSGSARPEGRLEALFDVLEQALEPARAGGRVEVRRRALADLELPLMVWGDPDQSEHRGVTTVREDAAWADAFILGTPEYHGSLSGALKNWFDFLYEELAGKVVSVVATTGGGTGDMSVTAVRTCASWCHAFVLPYFCAAAESQFDGVRPEQSVVVRLERMAHDMLLFAPALRSAYAQAKSLAGSEAGFADCHRVAEDP